MTRILIISAIAYASASALAADLPDSEIVFVVSGYPQTQAFAEFRLVKTYGEYIAEPTGEVIPEVTPETIGITAEAEKAEVFHPPKS